MNIYQSVINDLRNVSSPAKAKASAWFFKTAKGQYGYGDVFIGVTVPEQRKIAKKYFKDISLLVLQKLLDDIIHEYRLIALLMLVYKYQKSHDELPAGRQGKIRKQLFDFYIKNKARVNNWDLVDLSAPTIVGAFLENKDKSLLTKLAKSDSVWDRRIAMLATYWDIVRKKPAEALRIAETLIDDTHDLIRKAVGWMLREVGKRCSEKELETFLKRHYKTMPRTMLRYAIERLNPEKKLFYMKK